MTKKRIRSIRIFLTVIALAICIAVSPAAARVPQFCENDCRLGTADYYKVIDVLFPKNQEGDVLFVLRYIPAWEPERQIVISAKEEGNYEIHYFFLPQDSKRIGEQIARLRNDYPNDPPEKLAEHIKVEHKRINLEPKVLAGLMNSLTTLRVPPKLDSSVVLDGSIYDFWYAALSGCNLLHISVSDAHYGHDAKAYPLVRWMNRVRQAVESANIRSK